MQSLRIPFELQHPMAQQGEYKVNWPLIAIFLAMTFWPRKKSIIEKNPDLIPGGKASGMKPEDFNQKALKKGIEVEMEHTTSKEIAQEIAMDHLMEDPEYYEKLELIEEH